MPGVNSSARGFPGPQSAALPLYYWHVVSTPRKGDSLVTDTPVKKLRTILAAIDFSETSETGLDWAIDLAKTHGARMELVHALLVPSRATTSPAAWLASATAAARPTPPARCSADAGSGPTRWADFAWRPNAAHASSSRRATATAV